MADDMGILQLAEQPKGQDSDACPACDGTGKLGRAACPDCEGTGRRLAPNR